MNTKFLGGILLIIGTSIGGGMLALPVANGPVGFWNSSLLFLACWAVMTMGAFYILEVNLYLPSGKNMISMAYQTLGPVGLLITWICYLVLLYALLAAYISGGTDVLGNFLNKAHMHMSSSVITILFTILMGSIVYQGISTVDQFNRYLMFAKLGVYVVLVILVAPYMQNSYLHMGDIKHIAGPLMILMTSFGFATIVPNLREYFNDDLKTLKKVIFYGSLTPLICYLAWDAVIMGCIPSTGRNSLSSLLTSPHATSSLANMISSTVNSPIISTCFYFFTSICMLTAFLGVALCLFSFLADGLNMQRKGREGFGLGLLTFIPPAIVVIYYPEAFIHALSYAGFLCVILLLLLPVCMSLAGRKRFAGPYIVPGGRLLQIVMLIVSMGVILTAALVHQ